jgi:hypothetical protein
MYGHTVHVNSCDFLLTGIVYLSYGLTFAAIAVQ